MTVPVSVFENLRNGGPVSVPVFSNMDEKPDWTGLPSTSMDAKPDAMTKRVSLRQSQLECGHVAGV